MSRKSQFSGRLFRPYFFALALVISAAMLTVCYASVERTKYIAYYSAEQLAQKTAHQADSYIEELDFLAEQVKRQSNILNLFYELKDDDAAENYFDKNILSGLDVSSSLKNLLAGREQNFNITIYNGNGDVISSREYLLRADSVLDASARYEEMLRRITQHDEYLVLFPQTNVWTTSSVKYITLVKALKNSYSDEICGIIEIRSRAEDFIKSISLDIGEEYSVSVCDRATGERTGFVPQDLAEGKAITYPLENTNWEIEIKYTNPINTTFIAQLLIIVLLVYIILLFVVFRITLLISKRVSKPLTKLTEYVHTINAPGTSVDFVDNEAIDEIQDLEEGFSNMLERVNHLVNQEKKAYSLAIQAQMNPHFLYNTLAVISSAGEESGCEIVSDMCLKLSDMLRYVTEYERVTVPLRDEIEHTENYLSLMKSRYEDLFSYTVDIENSLLNMPVPKLFIQPLAENCFKHGFKEKAPPWNISIKMRGVPSVWELEIADNGTGVSEDKIAFIKSQIDCALREKSFDNTAGLGVANTIIRLKMTHNENMDYSIKGDDGFKIKIVSGKGDNACSR